MRMIIRADERRKRMIRKNNNADRYWISLVFLLASKDWVSADPHYHPMEDAIAGKDVHRVCRRSGVAVLCRLDDLDESDLDRLDPCLCSHLIYTAEMSASVPESWQKYTPEVKFLLTTSLVRWMQGGPDLSGLLSEVREGHFDGVDINVGEEAEETEALNTLQKLSELLNGDKRITSLTFVTGGFSEQILTRIDPVSFTFVTDFGQTDTKKGLPIPGSKLLLGVSVADLLNDDIAEDKGSQKCAGIASLKTEEESTGYEQVKMKSILNKMQHTVEDGKIGGIYIRSLANDDKTGACGAGSFPTLRFIRNKLNRDREPFGNFADLDIMLSTGESREVQFVLDLHTPREDLKKLPCDRVGFFRHPMDCTKFYHCSEYRASTTRFNQSGPYAGFLYKCPNGLVYDERQGSCIWPSWSNPCRGSGELLPVPAKKFSCVTPGFHVDPDNCRYFYYCSDLGDSQLEAFEFLCPSDLLGFDEKKLLCNWKWTVSECSSSSKETDVNTFSHKQGKAPLRYRISKALSLQYTPSLPFISPFPENAVVKNETSSQSNVSLRAQNQLAVLKNDTPNTLHTVPVSNNFISNKKLDFDKQNDVKLGTAVWQRSSVGTKRNDDNRNNTPSHVYSYSNSLGFNREYLAENNDTEPERPFKGRVIKLDLNRRTSQSSDPKLWDGKISEEIPRQMNSGLNPQDFKSANEHEKNYVIFENVANDDSDILSNQKPSPFMNVKCSKLLNKNREHEDVNTLGCTGEVSLTVKLNKGKDSNKYTLREDQITRSYQESQRISHLKIQADQNTNKYGTHNQDNAYKSERKSVVYPHVENITKNMSLEPARKSHKSDSISSVPNNLHAQSEDYVVIKRADSTKSTEHSSQISPKTKLPLNYETDEEYFDENRSLADRNRKTTHAGTTELARNQIVKSDSMPIHFYPQGVLLNINLVHVNQIPPDVLLEVDHMLKKYMDEGRIDADLLGEKLNASVEKMTEEKDKNSESEEITDMIRIIENIISPLDVPQEPIVTEPTYFQNNKTDATNNASLQMQHESVTTQAIKLSDKIVLPEYLQPQEELKNQTKYSDSQNIPLNAIQNVTKTRAFGRGRLLRKFKYPSIREQLDQQVSNPRESSKIVISDESPTYSFPPYTYPLRISQHSDKAIRTSFNRLPIHHVSMPTSYDNVIQTSVSPFKDRLKNVAIPENQYGSSLVDHGSTFMAENENEQQGRYFQQGEHSVDDHGSPITVQSKNGKQHLYSQYDDQSSVVEHGLPITIQNKNLQQEAQIPFVDHGLPVTKQNKNDQSVRYLQQEGQSSIAGHGLPITVQSKNYQQDQYLQHEGQISFVDYGLRVTVQHKNDQQDLFLQHRGQSSFLEPSLPVTKQNKDYKPDRYLQHRSQSSVVDHGRDLYFQNEGQISFVDHGLPVTAQDKNDQQDRYWQHEGQIKAARNNPFQEDRVDINSGAWRIYADTEPADIIASKIKENVSLFDNQRNENSPRRNENAARRSDEARRYRGETHAYQNEQYETYTQTYPYVTTTNNNAYESISGESRRTTEDKNNYDPRQNSPRFVNFENKHRFTNVEDGNAKNSFASTSHKIDQNNRPYLNDDDKSTFYGYKINGDFQENRKQKSNADGKSRDNPSNKQTKKRKKLRILVKKLEDDDSKSSTDDDKRDIEERISKSVLKSLKSRLLQKNAESIELQIQYQNHVWNIPFVNNESDLSPTICTRPGLFQHPRDCNMFYECFWDKWLRRFTLHVFACPVRLVYDHTVRGCSRPSADSTCNNHTS